MRKIAAYFNNIIIPLVQNMITPAPAAYKVIVMHNGKRPVYQIVQGVGPIFTLVEEPFYSSTWANLRIKQIQNRET